MQSAGDTIKFAIPTTDAGYNPVARTFTIVVFSDELTISKNLTIDGGNQRVIINRTQALFRHFLEFFAPPPFLIGVHCIR